MRSNQQLLRYSIYDITYTSMSQGGMTRLIIMPLCGPIMQAEICKIFSQAEIPRQGRVWQYLKKKLQPMMEEFRQETASVENRIFPDSISFTRFCSTWSNQNLGKGPRPCNSPFSYVKNWLSIHFIPWLKLHL